MSFNRYNLKHFKALEALPSLRQKKYSALMQSLFTGLGNETKFQFIILLRQKILKYITSYFVFKSIFKRRICLKSRPFLCSSDNRGKSQHLKIYMFSGEPQDYKTRKFDC